MNDIKTMSVNDIIPYENNPRDNEDAVDKVAASLREFGFKQPIVVDKDNIVIVGHTRLKAAKKLKMSEVPVLVADDLTDEQVKAYRLADNKTGEFAEWDAELLNFELDGIIDIDMSEFGFDIEDDEDKSVEVEEDEIPDDVEERCKLGDVWKLGNHRLICGDSTDVNVIGKLMDGNKAELLFTSPPYSDMRDYNGDKDLSVDNISEFITASQHYASYMAVNLGIQRKDGEIVQYWDKYIQKAKDNGLKLLAWNVWDKLRCGSIGQQKAFVPIRHEWIFVFGKEAKELNLTWEKRKSSIYADGRRRKVRQKDGSFKESSRGVTSNAFKKMELVVKLEDKDSIDSVTEQWSESGKISSKHPATFPVHLPAEYIIAFTDEDDYVLESFGGSGTTLMACEQLKRRCCICELDEHYCDVILQRWEDFTGEKAERI